MRGLVCSTVAIAALSACAPVPIAPERRAALDEQVTHAISDLKAVLPQLEAKMSAAPGYAVFPGVSKGGLVFGGAYGHGELFEDGRLVGVCEIAQGTVGPQIGGQVYRELVLFTTRDAIERFRRSRVVLSMQISAVAGPAGRGRAHRYEDGVEIFVLPSMGLMAEVSMGGQEFSFFPLEE